METIDKFRSITVKMTIVFFTGFVIACISFLLIYSVLNILLDDYFLHSAYIQNAEKEYVEDLQRFVEENRLSATDSDALRDWVNEKHITIFSVSRERVLIYDNTYVGKAPLVEADSQQLHYLWQYFYPVTFADGEADVYVYKNFDKNYYLIADITAVIISALLWICFFVFMIRHEAKYVLLLRKEVTAMHEGTLKNGFTQQGNDELNDLATALNQMRTALIEKELHEKQMRVNQEQLVLGMAHDLRTPLTGLMGYLEICRQMDSKTPNAAAPYVEKAIGKTVQIKDLSDKLFEFFLSNNDTPCILEPPANAEYLLNDYLSDLCAQLDNMGIQVASSGLEWRNVSIRINSDYLGRIINNMISNIEKYADRNKEVSLSSIYSKSEIGIRISNGIGNQDAKIQGTRIGVDNISKMMQQMNGRSVVNVYDRTYEITLYFTSAQPPLKEPLSR